MEVQIETEHQLVAVGGFRVETKRNLHPKSTSEIHTRKPYPKAISESLLVSRPTSKASNKDICTATTTPEYSSLILYAFNWWKFGGKGLVRGKKT
jgi:hypothetical protein